LVHWPSRKRTPWRGGHARHHRYPHPDGLLDPRKIPAENSNPLNRLLINAYHPLLIRVLHWPKATLLVAALSIFTVIWPLSQVGGEFLPKINEGDLLYMPSTLPGVSGRSGAPANHGQTHQNGA
jgi:Cu/Ag efflux pump CusA